MKKSTAYIVCLYSLLLIALGIKGYLKGSSASLYAGAGLGVLMLFSSIGLFFQKKMALSAALILTACLECVFIIRYLKTSASIPLILAIISLAIFCYLSWVQRSLCNRTNLCK